MIRVRVIRWVVLMAGLIVLFPGAAAAKNGTVVVNAPGTDDRSVTIRLDTLGAPDINNQEYTLESGRKTLSGFSITKVLRAAEVQGGDWLDVETLPSVEVDRPVGGPVRLTSSQLLGQSDRPPIFYENNGTTVFVMPGSPGREYVFRFTPVGIEIGTGKTLGVSLSSSPGSPRKGQAVTITASVTDAPEGAGLSYRWSFSDGKVVSTTVPRVVHRFSGGGSRSVVLTVVATDGQRAEEALAIDVIEGKDQNKGQEKDPQTQTGNTTGAGDGGGTAVPTTAGSGYGTGSGIGSGASSGLPSTSDAPSTEPSPGKEKVNDREGADGLEQVSGELIGPDVQVVELPPEEFASEGAGPSDLDEGPGFLGGAAGEAATLLGVGLLMALGGLIEVRLLSRRS